MSSLNNQKECPSCAMMVDADSKVCPICNYEFTEQPVVYKWVAILLIVLFILYMII